MLPLHWNDYRGGGDKILVTTQVQSPNSSPNFDLTLGDMGLGLHLGLSIKITLRHDICKRFDLQTTGPYYTYGHGP